ncbi:hypothetical protein MPTK2_3g24460 [Marchantia polymorpha subsp. ruderalis]
MDNLEGNDNDSCKCSILGKNTIGYMTIAMIALLIFVPGYYYFSTKFQIKALETRIRLSFNQHILHSQEIGNFRDKLNEVKSYTPRAVLVQNPSGRYMIAIKRYISTTDAASSSEGPQRDAASSSEGPQRDAASSSEGPQIDVASSSEGPQRDAIDSLESEQTEEPPVRDDS